MELTVYGDLLFATNFLMDLVILFLTVQMSGLELKLIRLTLAAALLALYGTVTFLPELSFFMSFLGRSAAGALAIWLLAPKSGLFGFLKARLILSLVSAGLGGVVYGLAVGTELGRNLCGIAVNGTVYFLLDMRLLAAGIILSYVLLILFRRSCIRNFSRDRILIPFTLTVGGEKVALTALADTGCELTAPITGEGVLLISEKILKGITPPKSFWLPIHTAGGDDRIPAFYPDAVECLSQRYQLEEMPLVGIVSGRLSRDGLYSGILNPQIIGEKNQGGGRNDENEVSTVLTLLTKGIIKVVCDSSQRGLLHRRERKSSVTSGKRRGRSVSGAVGYTGDAGASQKNPDREESAIGCLHSPEI